MEKHLSRKGITKKHKGYGQMSLKSNWLWKHPMLWMFVGGVCVYLGFLIQDEIKGNYNLETFYLDITGSSASYKTNDGKFACWWIEEVMRTPNYEDLGNFEKEIFQVSKKYCVELPRP